MIAKLPVCSVGVVTPLGAGGAKFAANLPDAGSAARIPPGVFDLLASHIPPKDLRRMDMYSRLGLLGALMAVEGQGFTGERGGKCALFVASANGATSSIDALHKSMPPLGEMSCSPTYFANSLHNSASAHISASLGITGPGSTASQLGASVAQTLLLAGMALGEPDVDEVLVGFLDEYSLTFELGAGTDCDTRFKEGAAFFLLSKIKPAISYLELGFPARAEKSQSASGYGSFPTAVALDLAIAACRRERREFTIDYSRSLSTGVLVTPEKKEAKDDA